MNMKPILRLNDIDIEVIRLREEEKLTFREIGEIINKSPSRSSEIYKHAKWVQTKFEAIDSDESNIKFSEIAAKHLPKQTWHSLMRKHKLDSKEAFLSMTDDEIKELRNVGFKGRLEIQKFMKFLGRDIETESFPFKDEDIDPEMLEIVKNFNRAEVETLFCCQGHFKDSEDGMSIPYLTTRFPKNERVLLGLIRNQSRYPMLNIRIDSSLPYTPELEEFCEVDEYINILDDALKHCEGGHINIGVNPIFYNLAEEIYSDETYYEKVFEHLRQKFVSDLLKLSEDILKIYRSNK